MSVAAMHWAMWQQKVKDPVARQVLLALANFAGERNEAFASVATLCVITHLGERTVRAKQDDLVRLGVMSLGNQAIAAAYIGDAGRRPTVYLLHVTDIESGWQVAQRTALEMAASRKGSRSSSRETGAGAAPLETGAGAAPLGCGSGNEGVQELPPTGAAAAPNTGIEPSIESSSASKEAAAPAPAPSAPPPPPAPAPTPVAPAIAPKEMTAAEFAAALVALGVSPQTAGDWVLVRKKKKATFTQTVLAALKRDVALIGCTFEDAVALCAARSWQGFDTSYTQVQALRPGTSAGKAAGPKSYYETDQLAKESRLDMLMPRRTTSPPNMPSQSPHNLLPGADGVLEIGGAS